MKLFRLILLTAIVTSFLLFYSCASSDPEPKSSTTELIAGTESAGKSWKLVRIDVDRLGSLSPFSCNADDNLTYFPTGRYEVNEGLTKCNPNDSPGYLGSWEFNAPEELLTINLPDSVRVWSVDLLEVNDLELTGQFGNDTRTYVYETR